MSMISEFVEKLINRLEEELKTAREMQTTQCIGHDGYGTPLQSKLGGEICALLKVQNIVNQLAEEYSDVPDTNVGKWIPVSERLPEDYDNRFYMCIVENHEEDLPMFCQYTEDYGFGYWDDIYDEDSLGFLDSEFKTNDELGYEKVIAWQHLPQSYKGE